jgi:DNA invertase Pin-like site-specific DNA recombinase
MQRETSLEDQIRVCREYAERHDWTWQDAEIYADAAVSGASIEGRTGLQSLLTAGASSPRPFDILLVDDSSRVARDLADALRVLQRLKFAGVRVIYISQGIDSASEQAETLVAVHGLVDSLYLREMAHKIRRGLAGQLERGFATGSSHYGYRAVPIPDPTGKRDHDGHPALLGKRLEIDDVEAAIIRRIFEWYAGGVGVQTIVRRLREERAPGPRGQSWKVGAVRTLLKNERLTGKQIWGQRRTERRPGTRQRVAKSVPRSDWRILERPDLRIVSDELWNAVQTRRRLVAEVPRQVGSTLMRGKNAALYSRHLFSGFMRCGVCGGAVTVVAGGWGSPLYGCVRRSKNGSTACSNKYTIRTRVADAALLEGLRTELLKPDTIAYIAARLAAALNHAINARPEQRSELERAKARAEQKLQNLITAVEDGARTSRVVQAIKDREDEILALECRLAAVAEPLHERLAVIPTWVRQQLEDVASLLSDVPERAKAEFQRAGLVFTLSPVQEPGSRPFLRAEGSGDFERLAFRAETRLTGTDHSTGSSERVPFVPRFAQLSEGIESRSTVDRLVR